MDKELVMYSFELKKDLAIKKKKILPSATIWMDVRGITLSEINQIQKDKYQMTSLICGIKKKQMNKTK